MFKLTVFIFLLNLSAVSMAAETCSRVATINYQEILVDVSNNNRGEGLRYYLEKDAVSKGLLDEYQGNNRATWKSAAVSTLGTGMILAGLLRTTEGKGETFISKNFLLVGGIGIIAFNYLFSTTKQFNNEVLLTKSIQEYNKRNTPKIFFSPTGSSNNLGLGVGVGQEF
ncbi:MAG TPA: hypothetical protein VNJ01_12600 [Bacteriovoracaceae bacterium]|nr:hypothetical protein [Bacteriovoracaceae bacterium]